MVKARKYVLVKHFVGYPKKDDFEIVEEELDPLKDGGKLCAYALGQPKTLSMFNL